MITDAPRSPDRTGNPTDFLRQAREHERDGRVAEAIEWYEAAVGLAQRRNEMAVCAQALRGLAVMRYRTNDADGARALCRRSLQVATDLGDDMLAARALNTHANVDLETGELDAAKAGYERALKLSGHEGQFRARLEQNLGILANIHGDLEEAQTHYVRALQAYEHSGDANGCAMAYHNLGLLSADRECWDDAQGYYRKSLTIAERVGDAHLTGLCLVNLGELDVRQRRFDQALFNANEALAIFERIGAQPTLPVAYRLLGMAYRETGRLELAEANLRTSLQLAEQAGAVLAQAETARECALLYRALGQNQRVLSYLNAAHTLFDRLDARVDLVNVGRSVRALENTYFAVVQEWGESIESKDRYTHGHCARVATYSVAVATALGLSEQDIKTIRIGAFLHDVGKVRVPAEILNKPGRLSDQEFDIIKKHTVWGVELLNEVDFPWDITPIIRWHHEKLDGSGYPDGLRGEELPVPAQIIGIVDVYDALTTTRSYRPAMSHEMALAEIEKCERNWRSDVARAFDRSVASRAA